MDTAKRPRIGEALVAAWGISPEAVERALEAQRQLGGVIGEHLVRQGAIEEMALLRALSRQTGLQHANLYKTAISPEAQRAVRLDTVRTARVLPVAIDGRVLALGMVNPADVGAERRVQEETRMTIRPLLLAAAQFDAMMALVDERGWGREPLRLEGLPPASMPPPMNRDLIGMLDAVVSAGGQDLYLTAGSIPSMRLDNELHRLPLDPVSGDEISALIDGVLTPQQQERFRDRLELDFAWVAPNVGRFRCNLYRQRGTLAFTARHVRDRIPSFDELGLPPYLRDFALRQQGLVLVVGPTGHGKSTTMASMVDLINRTRHANIITTEDPIEFIHQHRGCNVNQREVGIDTHSFAEGLRHAFRQAPDVLVIGEIRDHESAAIALSAAETGHLVMATMHALSATAAIDRLLDLFPGNQVEQARAQLADSLQLIFSQRLLRRASGHGRLIAFEHIGASAMARSAIREGRAHSLRSAMQLNSPDTGGLDTCLADLVASGKVTRDEALKYCDNPTFLTELFQARGLVPPEAHPPRA